MAIPTENQIFAVYKPKGPTSNDIVQKIKRLTGIKKVGHAGTLDPLAKGVLVVGIGRQATKQLGAIVQKEKEYLATIRLGATSTTDDKEGVLSKIGCRKSLRTYDIPNIRKVRVLLKKFHGKIKQTPPLYSAIKIHGQEAYKLARRGQTPKLKPRIVEIKKIQLISYHWPYLKIKAVTGPGVYIRSLARDIGKKLGTGAYLYNLERTRVGEYTKAKAITFDKIKI